MYTDWYPNDITHPAQSGKYLAVGEDKIIRIEFYNASVGWRVEYPVLFWCQLPDLPYGLKRAEPCADTV